MFGQKTTGRIGMTSWTLVVFPFRLVFIMLMMSVYVVLWESFSDLWDDLVDIWTT